MNVFIFLFLSAAMVTAAPHAASILDKHHSKSGKPVSSTVPKCEQKKRETVLLLRDVVHHVNRSKMLLREKMLQKEVQNVFMNKECNRTTLCEAGKVLSAYNSSSLGLKSPIDWKLPRILLAYSNCTTTDQQELIQLDQLLDQIKRCGQKELTNHPNPCQ
ncbi:hypothetical protein Q7C36_014940 [Tachysurus vachellii]|uniref:Interleukin-4 n=1 Tax=Tachysurus vachellii TaxID=175792 RepID=A0AA88SEK6_TACVA|nr:hypothetical protein Q7C36_014940 [Tachysurus vachellii]